MAVTFSLLVNPVLAAPPPGYDPNSEIAKWYNSLMQPGTNIPCCGPQDCRVHDYRGAIDHYEIKIIREGEEPIWIPVPNDKVLWNRTDNPTGLAVACVGTSTNADDTVFYYVYCFIKASES